jgi:hypothetical protein
MRSIGPTSWLFGAPPSIAADLSMLTIDRLDFAEGKRNLPVVQQTNNSCFLD